MVPAQAKPVLEKARQLLRHDAKRAPAVWRVLFADLEGLLFDPGLRLVGLRRTHGLGKPKHTQAFAKELGCGPDEYVLRLRVETGVRLLVTTQLDHWEIAPLVGFASRSSFEKAVVRRYGRSPAAFRPKKKRSRAVTAASADRRRLLGLALDPGQAAEALRHLQESSTRVDAPAPTTSLLELEQWAAEQWWAIVHQLPAEERGRQLATGLFTTSALFEHLCRQSRAEGRDDRQRGVVIARLAIESLLGLRGYLSEPQVAHLEARAWACLGNALCLAFDYPRSERAFRRARKRLVDYPAAPPALAAEIDYLESCLHRYQRRFGEARARLVTALALCPPEASRLRAEILLARGDVCWHGGEYAEAIADFMAALELLDGEREPYLAWVATFNLAATCWRCGKSAEAESWLQQAEPLAYRLGRRQPLCHVLWLGGLIDGHLGRPKHAEPRLREAREGFESVGDRGHAAVVAIDLAQLQVREGRTAEAATEIAKALPHLAQLGLDTEGLAALELLRRAVETNEVSLEILERVRALAGQKVAAPEV